MVLKVCGLLQEQDLVEAQQRQQNHRAYGVHYIPIIGCRSMRADA